MKFQIQTALNSVFLCTQYQSISPNTYYIVAFSPTISGLMPLIKLKIKLNCQIGHLCLHKDMAEGTVAALGWMRAGAPSPNLPPLIVLDLGKSPPGSVMLGLPRDKDEH